MFLSRLRLAILFAILGLLVLGGFVYRYANVDPAQENPEQARGMPFGGHGRGNLFELLRRDTVCQELQITKRQQRKLEKFVERTKKDMLQQKLPDLQSMSPEERQQWVEGQQEREQDAFADAERRLDEVLQPEQLQRLHQISLQIKGVVILLDSEVQDALELSAPQRERLKYLVDTMSDRTQSRIIKASKQLQGQALSQRIGEIKVEAQAEMYEVLTRQQVAKLQDLRGDPFPRSSAPAPAI